jgi:hypothetical protein
MHKKTDNRGAVSGGQRKMEWRRKEGEDIRIK